MIKAAVDAPGCISGQQRCVGCAGHTADDAPPTETEPTADVFVSQLEWSGAAKGPTHDSATFSRDLTVSVDSITLPMSAAPGYRGDSSRANPEQLLVASLSACQALTYLFLAAKRRIAVTGYTDDAQGWLGIIDGKMCMSRVRLRPHITLQSVADEPQARELVDKAHQNCFIGNSVSVSVEIEPTFTFMEVPTSAR